MPDVPGCNLLLLADVTRPTGASTRWSSRPIASPRCRMARRAGLWQVAPMQSGRFAPTIILCGFAFAILALAITTRVPKWLTDFDQSFYITIAYDLDRHGVFSNGVFDKTDSTEDGSAARHVLRPGLSGLVYAAMRVDPRFKEAVACAVEAQHKKRDHKTCEVYARPIHLLHALFLALGVVAIACVAEMIVGGRFAFWGAGAVATAGLMLEADLFSFVMTESLVFSLYSLMAACMVAGMICGRLGRFVAAGCLLGVLCLTRASYLVLAPAIAVLILAAGYFALAPAKLNWRQALAFLVAFVVVFTPWIGRNAIVLGKPAISEEYGSAALIERFAFNDMSLREFLLAFPYCVPQVGPAGGQALAGPGAMSRFEYDTPGSFFVEGRTRRDALVAKHEKLDPVMGTLMREEMARNWWRHIAVSLPLAWCGSWVSGVWSLVFFPLFLAGGVIALRRREPLLLLYAAPAFVMVALHAGVANHYPRYNLGLIGPYAVAAMFVLARYRSEPDGRAAFESAIDRARSVIVSIWARSLRCRLSSRIRLITTQV